MRVLLIALLAAISYAQTDVDLETTITPNDDSEDKAFLMYIFFGSFTICLVTVNLAIWYSYFKRKRQNSDTSFEDRTSISIKSPSPMSPLQPRWNWESSTMELPAASVGQATPKFSDKQLDLQVSVTSWATRGTLKAKWMWDSSTAELPLPSLDTMEKGKKTNEQCLSIRDWDWMESSRSSIELTERNAPEHRKTVPQRSSSDLSPDTGPYDERGDEESDILTPGEILFLKNQFSRFANDDMLIGAPEMENWIRVVCKNWEEDMKHTGALRMKTFGKNGIISLDGFLDCYRSEKRELQFNFDQEMRTLMQQEEESEPDLTGSDPSFPPGTAVQFLDCTGSWVEGKIKLAREQSEIFDIVLEKETICVRREDIRASVYE